MESIIQQGEDVLVAPLDFSIGQNSAQYIVGKEEATYFSSQNLVSPQGVKIAKFQVGQPTGFLDLSSLYFRFTLKNTGSADLTPLTAEAHCLIKRLIVRASGTLLESIELFSTSEEYARRLLPLEKRLNLANMFLGASGGTNGHDLQPNSLGAGESRLCLFRPMTSAVLNLSKYWPALLLGSTGLTFELECADVGDAMADAASTYELSDLRILCNVVQLDSTLTDQYTSLLLSGKSVFMDLELHENTVHHLPGNSAKFAISSARQYSRLNTLIAILQRLPDAGVTATQTVNNFYLPASASQSIQSNLVVNGERQPAFNCEGIAEFWIKYLRGTGAYANIGTSTSTSLLSFQGTTTGTPAPARGFSIVYDLEKMPSHAQHTGKPIDSGGILTLHIEGAGANQNEYVERVILQHHFSGMLEIRDSGCTLYT